MFRKFLPEAIQILQGEGVEIIRIDRMPARSYRIYCEVSDSTKTYLVNDTQLVLHDYKNGKCKEKVLKTFYNPNRLEQMRNAVKQK